jgi:hypothetical protein
MLFGAWVTVFIFWLITLMKYCKAYREYEQSHGKPYKSPIEDDKLTGITLKYLRRLGLLISKHKLNPSHDGTLKSVGSRSTSIRFHFLDKILNLGSGRVFHKSKNGAKMPNDELTHGGRGASDCKLKP